MSPSRLLGLAIGVAAAGAAVLAPSDIRSPSILRSAGVRSAGRDATASIPTASIPTVAAPSESRFAAVGTGPGVSSAVRATLSGPTPTPDSTKVAYTPDTDGLPGKNPAVAAAPDAPVAQIVMRNALAAYAAGDLRAGDVLASEIGDPLARTALEWQALHAPADIGFDRFSAFLAAHPRWPGADWTERRAEDALYRDKRSPSLVASYFAARAPQTAMGALALARARLAEGRKDEAAALARAVWRDDDLFPSLETALRKEFGAFLNDADDKYRADRMLYKGDVGAGLRAAAHAGAAELALARIRVAALGGRASPAVMKTIPAALRGDPSFLFAEIQRLHQADKAKDAAQLMLTASHDPHALIDGDAWWLERRWLARKLLDLGDAKTAYRICADAAPGSAQTDIDAQFHAGWIALRYLSDPKTAESHFLKLAAAAQTPVSKARAYYWLGRAEAALGAATAAAEDFRAAAAYPTAYYGQLAETELGQALPPLPASPPAAAGDRRAEVVRVVELLGALGARDSALSLAIQAAHALDDPAQLAALASVGRGLGDARETLAVGKIAARRGFALDADAFPTFGVPKYAPLAHSAPTEVVYAVARQESAFQTDALSSAGARGLMQMILSTARHTAERYKIPFDPERLTKDPAFNAELGAAHLGQLLSEQRGSLILTFAAYNAGGRRVQEWIDAYGDPRRPGVDPVDWVERIPLAETRDYVQRVMENFNVYKARFAALKDTQIPPPPNPAATLAGQNGLLGPAVDPPAAASQAKL